MFKALWHVIGRASCRGRFKPRPGSGKHVIRLLLVRLREKTAAFRPRSVLTVKKEPDIKHLIKQGILELFPSCTLPILQVLRRVVWTLQASHPSSVHTPTSSCLLAIPQTCDSSSQFGAKDNL